MSRKIQYESVQIDYILHMGLFLLTFDFIALHRDSNISAGFPQGMTNLSLVLSASATEMNKRCATHATSSWPH